MRPDWTGTHGQEPRPALIGRIQHGMAGWVSTCAEPENTVEATTVLHHPAESLEAPSSGHLHLCLQGQKIEVSCPVPDVGCDLFAATGCLGFF